MARTGRVRGRDEGLRTFLYEPLDCKIVRAQSVIIRSSSGGMGAGIILVAGMSSWGNGSKGWFHLGSFLLRVFFGIGKTTYPLKIECLACLPLVHHLILVFLLARHFSRQEFHPWLKRPGFVLYTRHSTRNTVCFSRHITPVFGGIGSNMCSMLMTSIHLPKEVPKSRNNGILVSLSIFIPYLRDSSSQTPQVRNIKPINDKV